MPTVLTVGSLLLPSLSLSAQAQTRTLAGSVTLLGWKGTAPSNLLPTSLTYLLADQTSPRLLVRTVPYNAATRSTQAFSFSVPPGNYKVTAKMDRFLRTLALGDVRNGNLTNLSLSLPGGDADNSNAVNVDDLTLVLNAYNSATTTQTAGADVDGSGSIDVDDLTVVLNNYNTTGASEPTAAPWHLADLSLSTSGVPAGTTLTGRVTLASAAPPGGTTVTLRTSLDYYATFSSSAMMNVSTRTLTIRAGETQSDLFTVYTANTYFDGEVDHPLTEPAYATISASAFGWTRSAPLTVSPTNPTLSVQNLAVIPGNGCVLLDWDEIPDGFVKGFNVYRRLPGGNSSKLNTLPLADNTYSDAGLSNGTYEYRVSSVSLTGVETFTVWTSVITDPTADTISWIGAPTQTVSGRIRLRCLVSTGETAPLQLIVEDQIVGHFGNEDQPDAGSNPLGLVITLNSELLKNGLNKVKIKGCGTKKKALSAPPISINVQNTVSSHSESTLFNANKNETGGILATLPSNEDWKYQILDKTGSPLRTWKGTGIQVNVEWDGKDDFGSPLPIASYPTRFSHSGSEVATEGHISPSGGGDIKGLALVDFIADQQGIDDYYAIQIENDFDTMAQNSLGAWKGLVLRGDGSKPGSKFYSATVRTIERLLSTTLTDFSLSGHGAGQTRRSDGTLVPRRSLWNSISFWPKTPPKDCQRSAKLNIVVPFYTGAAYLSPRIFNFVWMDVCNSGGDGGDRPGVPSADWALAFGISDFFPGRFDNYPGVTLTWNGFIGANDTKFNTRSVMRNWRVKFWDLLTSGQYVRQAYINAAAVGSFTFLSPYGGRGVLEPDIQSDQVTVPNTGN